MPVYGTYTKRYPSGRYGEIAFGVLMADMLEIL